MKLSENNQLKAIGLIGMWVGVTVAAFLGHSNYIGWAMFISFLVIT